MMPEKIKLLELKENESFQTAYNSHAYTVFKICKTVKSIDSESCKKGDIYIIAKERRNLHVFDGHKYVIKFDSEEY